MKKASRQVVPKTTEQCELTAEFLEDLAAHAGSDREREEYEATARNFRQVAQESRTHNRSKRKQKPDPKTGKL